MAMLLFGRGRITGEEFASRLGVTLRTVYRDIVGLEESGFPVAAVPGPTGGFEFDYVAAGAKGIRTEQGLIDWFCESDLLSSDQASFATVLDIASSALGDSDREVLGRIRDRILFDPEEWYSRERPSEKLGVIRRAVLADSVLKLRYAERTGEEVVADDFDPFGLVWKGGFWYVFGFSHNDQRFRRIRVQRIAEAHEIGEIFERPKGFDLYASWHAELESFGKGSTRVILRIGQGAIPEFENFNWKEENRIEKFTDHWIVEMMVDRYEWIMPLVLSYSGEVIILEPDGLKSKIINAARAVIAAHGEEPGGTIEGMQVSGDTRARAGGYRVSNIRNG